MFYAFRVGVGSVGVISNITFRIEERQICRETTSVLSIDEMGKNHQQILNTNKIVKYLWIPYTNDVLVKLVNPVSKEESEAFLKNHGKKAGVGDESVKSFNRRALLERGILDTENIKATNKEEIKFLRTICGERIGHLEDLIVFNCESWKCVFEVAFKKEGLNDLQFMKELYEFFEKNNIPAHSPIEQRWTLSSRSWMSPAYSENPNDVYCWVGLLIMHLHRSNTEEAKKGLEKFNEISAQLAPLLEKYNAFPHWAKIESVVHSNFLTKRLQERFPKLERFRSLRKQMDPNYQMSNKMTEILFN
jgi:L-galactono-1,4-lactone dehydrogenase